MSITSQLSSHRGERTEQANHLVAARCIKKPALLTEIAKGLSSNDDNLIADCAEVMTYVAEQKPMLVKPYIKQLLPSLDHKKTKVRWEVAHTLSFIVGEAPTVIGGILPKLKGMAVLDESTIVRDYTTWTISNYAQVSAKAAHQAVDALEVILDEWKEKQAAKVIQGFIYAVQRDPTLKRRIATLVQPYELSSKSIIKTVIKELHGVMK